MAYGTCAACGEEGNLKRGWCASKCYKRWYRTGDPLAVAFLVDADDETRFWFHVSKNGPTPAHCPELGPCHLWTGGRDESGYGLFYYTETTGKRRKTRAHRWLLGHQRGKLLSRDVVGEEDGCHRCDNPPCVNPAHLYVGTRKQNIADAVDRKRIWQLKVDVCPKGHPLDGVKVVKGRTRRYCKTCGKAGQRQHRTLDRTHCKNDHLLEGDNVLLCKNGTRKCRICDAERLAKAHPGFTYQP